MTELENDKLWLEYFYPNTHVLKNKLGITDYNKLKEEEATLSFEKLLELMDNPISMNCDKNHLIEIHKYLFNDIYPFAGEYRKVNMQKEAGSFLFISEYRSIDGFLDELFMEIDDDLSKCRNKHDFCDILSRLYTQLIFCHPFREGNGRSIREFIREFSMIKSKELGIGDLELDWSLINRDELNEYIEVAHIFPNMTQMLFEKALVNINNVSNENRLK